jgi:hypothetical protein
MVYQVPNEIIKEYDLDNSVNYYESFIEVIDALKEEKITYAFLPTNYDVLFGDIEGYEDLMKQLKLFILRARMSKALVTSNNSVALINLLLYY